MNPGGGEQSEALVREQKIAHFLKHLKIIQKKQPRGSILDVGCAKGYFVELALREGYSAYGLEISEYAGAKAAQAVGRDRIKIGKLEDALYPPSSFDIITMFDFIEHTPDLDAALTAASRMLKSGGLLYFVTPNTPSLSCRLMGSGWWHYKKEHLFYFNHTSLEMLLSRFGFHQIKSVACKKTVSIEYIFSQLRTYPVFLISSLAQILVNLVPSRLRKKFITLPSGEFIMMACKKS